MTGQPEDRISRDTRRGRDWLTWLKVVAAIQVNILLAVAIWASIAWKQANNEGGTFHAKANVFLDKLNDKLDQVDMQGVNKLIADGQTTIHKGGEAFDSLQPVERAATNTIALVGRESAATMQVARSQIAVVGPALEELHRQIKQNGDAAHDLLVATTKLADKFGLTADEAADVLKQTSANLGVSMEALTKRINDHRLDDILDSAAKSAAEANGTLVDFHADLHKTMAQMPDIAADIHKTTTNIARYSKVSIIVSILSRLASALIPGILN